MQGKKKKIEEVGVNEEMELKSVDDGRRYGDGVAWKRGAMLGKGSFGCVFMATLKKKKPKSNCSYFPPVMAVKSAEVSVSGSIQKEREVLSKIKGNPYVIRCYGEETTTGENGEMVYNLLLEYGSGGTLADRINKSGLPEFEVRFHTRSLLRGLNHIHMLGYVHCDLKPHNIFLVPTSGFAGGVELTQFRAKIGDFGLTKRGKLKQSKKRRLEPYWRGTPMYLSPETVKDNVQEAPSDVWALGCIVLEMLTGKPPWPELDSKEILRKIGEGELPKIPSELSKDARDFLKGCFVKNDMYRLTAEMLFNHPFLEGLIDDDWQFEEVEEVEDINVIDSILLVSDIGDEFGSGWCCVSEDEESLYYWSDEDVGKENPSAITPSSSETSLEVTSEVKYPIDYTIRAGV